MNPIISEASDTDIKRMLTSVSGFVFSRGGASSSAESTRLEEEFMSYDATTTRAHNTIKAARLL